MDSEWRSYRDGHNHYITLFLQRYEINLTCRSDNVCSSGNSKWRRRGQSVDSANFFQGCARVAIRQALQRRWSHHSRRTRLYKSHYERYCLIQLEHLQSDSVTRIRECEWLTRPFSDAYNFGSATDHDQCGCCFTCQLIEYL